MNFIILGISEFAIHCTQALIDSGANILAFISMPESSRPNNPVDFSSFVGENNIPYYELDDINCSEGIKILIFLRLDYILCLDYSCFKLPFSIVIRSLYPH